MKAFNLATWATCFLAVSSFALGEGDSRIERGVLAVGQHAEVRGFESFELLYQGDGTYSSQSGDVTGRDGAEGASYKGQDAFSITWNHDIDVSISSDQPYYYLKSILSPAGADTKERIDAVTDRLSYDGVETTTLAYRSVLDTGAESADSKDFILSSEVELGDVADQKAGVYQKVYTVTVAASGI